VLPDDYLTTADEMLSHAHRTQSASDEIGEAYRVEAQVKAIQAVAAAIDRLAAAVEALSPPSPSRPRPGGPSRGSSRTKSAPPG
jgi:hypothetical protein